MKRLHASLVIFSSSDQSFKNIFAFTGVGLMVFTPLQALFCKCFLGRLWPLSSKIVFLSILCFRDLAVHHQYRRSPKFLTDFVSWPGVPLFEKCWRTFQSIFFNSDFVSWACGPLSVGLKSSLPASFSYCTFYILYHLSHF